MKYKVIGWDDMEGGFRRAQSSESVLNAVIEEIRAHGYRFGGDAHERYCPVMNDGTYAEFSWRGWGGVMARAWEPDDTRKLKYMDWYMDDFAAKKSVYPPDERVDESKIVPPDTIADTHVMHLKKEPFEKIKSGAKNIEFRLNDDKRKAVDIGDLIELHLEGSDETLTLRVVDRYDYSDFDKLYDLLRGVKTGYDTKEEFLRAMSSYYTDEQQKKYGAVGFKLEADETVLNGAEYEIDLWGEKKTLPVYAEEPEREKGAPLYSDEVRELKWFLWAQPHNDDEVKAAIAKYLKKIDFPEEFTVDAIIVHQHRIKFPTVALSAHCGEVDEWLRFTIVFNDREFDGVGDDTAYLYPDALWYDWH